MVNKVTKNPEAQARGKKAWETQLEKIKAKHLEEISTGTSSSTPSTPSVTPSTSSITPSVTSSWGIGGVVILCIGGVYYLYTKKTAIVSTNNASPAKTAAAINDDIFKMN